MDTARFDGETERLVDRLKTVSPRQRRAMLVEFLEEQLGYVLGVEKGSIDRSAALMDAGMDSLKAIEAKLYLEDELGIELGSSLLFDYPSINALADFLLESMNLQPAQSPAATTIDPVSARLEDVDQLSTDEVAALLEAELAGVRLEAGGTGR